MKRQAETGWSRLPYCSNASRRLKIASLLGLGERKITIKKALVFVLILVAAVGGLLALTLHSGIFLFAQSMPVQQTIADTNPTVPQISFVPASIWLLITALIVLTALSISISFYLYRWRRLLIDGSPYLVPEDWAKHLDAQSVGLDKLIQVLNQAIKGLFSNSDHTSKQISTLSEAFMTLRSVIDDRDSEVKRLKRGYDRDIYARFLSRFIRLDIAIREQQNIEMLSRLSQDALDECGIESFSPAIGSDYRTLGKQVADNPKTIMTSDPTQHFLIAEVLERGYALRSPEGLEIHIPAKVSIFQSNN